MTTIDWIIVFVYALSTIGLGWYFGRQQKDTKEYFVGSGTMNPFLIGVSLFATLLSTISYLAIPGELLGKGPVYMTNYLAYPFVFIVVGSIILPVYMRQRVASAYELLEEKLGVSVRMLGVTMFLLLRLVWMSMLVYLTADTLKTMLGMDDEAVKYIVLVTGAFAITYTTLGGLRAVVITDTIQTILLYGGALLVIGTISVEMGGFGWFPTEWQDEVWDTQPIFSLDPSTRVTVVGSILSVFLWMVCTSMGDQVSVQRFMATKDAAAAKLAIGMQLTVSLVVGVTLGLVGVALLGYYQANPGELPAHMNFDEHGDDIFGHFIAFKLPAGITGLVVAGLFAAAMSSIDSGVNSITAVTVNDILPRFKGRPATDAEHVRTSRWLAVAIGAIVMSLSLLIKYVPGNFMGVTNKTVNLLTVPIALLFVFALFVRSANTRGVWTGVLSSVVVAVLIAFSGPLFGADPQTGNDPVSFQWISPCAFLVGLSVGLAASRFFALNISVNGCLLFSALVGIVAYKVFSLEIRPLSLTGALIAASWAFLFIAPKPKEANA